MHLAHDVQRSLVDRALEATRVALTLRELDGDVLPDLGRAVGASQALLFRFGPNREIEVLGGSVVEHMHRYVDEFFEGDAIHRRLERVVPERYTLVTADLVDDGVLRRCAAFDEFYHPLQMDHLVALWLTDVRYGTPGMTGLLLARDRPFRDDEHRTLRSIQPDLAAVRQREQRLAREREIDVTRAAEEYGLTPAEARVLERIALGFGNAEIAKDLGVSMPTVKTHVGRVLAKLGVTSRTQAAFEVLRTSWL